jgi:hypothetical protein
MEIWAGAFGLATWQGAVANNNWFVAILSYAVSGLVLATWNWIVVGMGGI